MEQENEPQESTESELEGTEIRQVQWAWLWSSLPWVVVLAVMLYLGFLEEVMTSVILIIIIVPRYFMWRRTKFTLTDDVLLYQRGGITSSKAYPLPLTKIKDVRTRYGLFGRALGYQGVDVLMDNGAVANMAYLPIVSDVSGKIRALIDQQEPAPDEEDSDSETPADSPPQPESPPSGTDNAPDDPPRSS
jgi:uncharacterized membrane protein YdbT with pleckstrin-like domain